MRGYSHLIIGGALGAVIATHTGSEPLGIAAGAIGALVPDIDHPDSLMGRWFFFWPAVRVPKLANGFQRTGRVGIPKTIWHRGQLHSVGFAVLSTVAMALLYRLAGNFAIVPGLLQIGLLPLVAVCFGVGVLSHLAADCVNVSPMMLFWPFSHKMVTAPIPHASQRSAMGHIYELLVVVAVVGVAYLLAGGSLQAFQSPATIFPW